MSDDVSRTNDQRPKRRRRPRTTNHSAGRHPAAKRTTITKTALRKDGGIYDDGIDHTLPYVPSRAIAPITPTPPAENPLSALGRRATIVSRRYDLESSRPLYRVRVEPVRERDAHVSCRAAAPAVEVEDGEQEVCLMEILDYVSPAELERFELEWEDDMVLMVDADGTVLAVDRETQRAMMGWDVAGGSAGATVGGATAAAVATTAATPSRATSDAEAGPPAAGAWAAGQKRAKKVPTRAFVDRLPPLRRRRRAKIVKPAQEVMGIVGGDGVDSEVGTETADQATTTDYASETADCSTSVHPARVRDAARRQPARQQAAADPTASENEPNAFDSADGLLDRWRAGAVLMSEEELSEPSTGRI